MTQPVAAVSAVQRTVPVSGKRAGGGDFLSALRAQQAAAPAPGAAAGEAPKTSWWTDEALATFVGDGRPIDTTNTINWASAGGHQLTGEEIADLKTRYDVDHLSPQGYYDLMSELTHLGAISGEECMGVHLRHFGDESFVFRPYTGPGHALTDFPRFRTQGVGRYLNSCIDFLMEELAATRTADFRQHNPHLNGSYVSGLEKDIAVRQRVAAVLDQLR